MALITKIEEILSIPMEMIHNQRGFHPVDLCRKAVRCMERGMRKGIRQTYSPNRFQVLLNTIDYRELYPFVDMIRSDIKGELRRVVEERGYFLAGDLDVDLIMDDGIKAGKPEVISAMMIDDDRQAAEQLDSEDMPTMLKEGDWEKDSATVIQLHEKDAGAQAIETGIDHLRAGRTDEALTVLQEAAPREDLQSHFHAAMAVALDMSGRQTEALPHYQNLKVLDGPRLQVQRRLEWAERFSPPTSEASNGEDTARVALNISGNGIELENIRHHSAARVNGCIVQKAILRDGDEIQIGDMVLICSFKENQENGL